MTVFDPRGRENKRSDRWLLPLCALGFVDCRLVHRYDRYAGNVSAEKGSMVQKLGNVFVRKVPWSQNVEMCPMRKVLWSKNYVRLKSL